MWEIFQTNVLSAKFDVYTKIMKDFMTRIHIYNYQDQGEFVKDVRLFYLLTEYDFILTIVVIQVYHRNQP